MSRCILCKSKKNQEAFLPKTVFNDKIFQYRKCSNCELVFIDPIPTIEDYIKMYPPSYQGSVDSTIREGKLPGLRFSYRKQFQLIDNYLEAKNDALIADVGCGNGNFIANAMQRGYKSDGVEFNPKQVELLKNHIAQSSFYTQDEFFTNAKKYDLIRLSNVLEHLDDPIGSLTDFKKKLTSTGVLLLEGPIETNFNLALQVRKFYFFLKKLFNSSYLASHTPTHIFFTNRENQLRMFEQGGFATHHFEIIENAWPFPEKIDRHSGIGDVVKWCFFKFSKSISSVIRSWGNTFIYIGKSR